MPSLLGLGEEDPILQIEVDNSRNILYTRSEKGAVTVSDFLTLKDVFLKIFFSNLYFCVKGHKGNCGHTNVLHGNSCAVL